MDRKLNREVLPKICFIAHNAYGALVGEDSGHSGGIEWQQTLMAKWLARRGFSVSMITWDEGTDMVAEVSGISIFKLCRKKEGFKGLRFFYPRWSSLYNAMKSADADIYYYNCGDLGLGQIVLNAHRLKKKVVYSVASEVDCDPTLPALLPWRERYLYRRGLLDADKIIVQTRKQQSMLRDGFEINGQWIPMPCLGFDFDRGCQRPTHENESAAIVWIGRISSEKRVEWLLEIAARIPEATFHVVGSANAITSYTSDMIRRMNRTENIRIHGRVVHAKVGSFLNRSDLLLNTSIYEGFPNTFLEAWSVGLPVVSSFDPDSLIREKNLGAAVQDIDAMVDAIRDLISDRGKWTQASANCLEYFERNHRVEAVMPVFERVFVEVARDMYLIRCSL